MTTSIRTNTTRALLGMMAAVTAVTSAGCIGLTQGPSLGIFAIPIPVSPFYQQKAEDDNRWLERYERVPILGPTTAGNEPVALDPPSDDEVMRAFEKANPVGGGIPLLFERQRNDVRIIKEKIADYIDPPRFYPLMGPAQLHHAHYKCTIYYSQRDIVGYPVPHSLDDEEAVETIYIDHNHFHMVGDVEPYKTPTL